MITITDEGAKRVNHFLEGRQSGLGIRVKITTTGCSGYAYQLEFADETNDDDTVFESNILEKLTSQLKHNIDYCGQRVNAINRPFNSFSGDRKWHFGKCPREYRLPSAWWSWSKQVFLSGGKRCAHCG